MLYAQYVSCMKYSIYRKTMQIWHHFSLWRKSDKRDKNSLEMVHYYVYMIYSLKTMFLFIIYHNSITNLLFSAIIAVTNDQHYIDIGVTQKILKISKTT